MNLTPYRVGRALSLLPLLAVGYQVFVGHVRLSLGLPLIMLGLMGLVLTSWEDERRKQWQLPYVLLLVPFFALAVWLAWTARFTP